MRREDGYQVHVDCRFVFVLCKFWIFKSLFHIIHLAWYACPPVPVLLRFLILSLRTVHKNDVEGFTKIQIPRLSPRAAGSASLGWSLRICISDKFPQSSDATMPQTTLGLTPLFTVHFSELAFLIQRFSENKAMLIRWWVSRFVIH